MRQKTARPCIGRAAFVFLAVILAEFVAAEGVTVIEKDDTVSLSNDRITMVLAKSMGEVDALIKDGHDVTGKHTLYYDVVWRPISEALNSELRKKLLAGIIPEGHLHYFVNKSTYLALGRNARYDLIAHDEKHAHVRFVNTQELPFSVEVHYVLFAGDSGFYCYVVNRRNEDSPAMIYEQSRFLLRIGDGIFDTKLFSEEAGPMKLFSAEEMSVTHQYADAEQFPDGSVLTKYDTVQYEAEHHVHGMTGNGIGFWVISPSNEYVNGGPTKQNITIDENYVSIVTKRMFQGGHFGSGTVYFDKGEKWAKINGPFFVYLNEGKDFDAMWDEARQRTQQEIDAWPYSWVTEDVYPVERGAVKGRLCLTDGTSPQGATVILAAPQPDWQQQGKGYIFWSRADREGYFEISKVRPGQYTLYAFVSGVLGEFRRDHVPVAAGAPTDLGQLTWLPVTYGKRLWQIGVPDRSGREFRHGEDFRHWGRWLKYAEDFPDDVKFTIGVSKEKEDWNYVQPAVLLDDGTYRFPVWRIGFDLAEAPLTGQAVLSMPLAEVSSYSPDNMVTIKVSLNDTEVGRFREYGDDGGVARSGIQGLYRPRTVTFDATILRQGKNTISLQYDAQQPSAPLEAWPLVTVIYDCLRLELCP